MANTEVQTEKPLPRQATRDGVRRWSAVLGLTAAVAMGWPVVACDSHGKTGPTTTTTTTTTADDHARDGGKPVEPPPGGTAPGTTVTQTVTPGLPTYAPPPLQAPGDFNPFGGHWVRQPALSVTVGQ
jgi:hypothetical protein